MFRNYFKTSIRNLVNRKLFTFINVAGLAVGITGFIALMLFVFDELGYDQMYKNSENIYRAYIHQKINSEESWNSKTPSPFGATMKNVFPEVENYTRIGSFGNHVFKCGEKVFRESHIYVADSTYFEVFNLPLIYGDPNQVLTQPNSIVITETAAQKYFGNENPVGKTFIVDNKDTYLITGLMKDFPKKSHFSCDFLLSMSTYPITGNNYWLDLWYTTYLVLKKGTDPAILEKKMHSVTTDYLSPQAEKLLGISMNEFFAAGNFYQYKLQPLKSIHLYSQREYNIDLNSEWSDVKSSDVIYVYIVSIIALFVLLLAVINFINLSTARSEKRAKEVGIRKTLGSDRKKLIAQFITESTIMSFCAVLIALMLLEIVLPPFNGFLNRELSLNLVGNWYTIPVLLVFVFIVGLLAGSYPAFYLSSFQPVQVIKPWYSGRGRKQVLRSVMVIGQFAVSITLIAVTIIINNQLKFIQNKNLGFNKEHLVSINNINAIKPKLETFKNELAKNPNILSMTNSSRMFQTGVPGNGFIFGEQSKLDIFSGQYLDVDYDFLKTYQIELKQGRFFSKEYSSDSNAVLINESAVKKFGVAEPIGQSITRIENKPVYDVYTIIGVIKDFNYQSLREAVHPLILHLHEVRQPGSMLTLRIASNDMVNTIDYIKDTWQNFAGDEYFDFSFVNERLAKLYENEERVGIITTVFSALAVFIACLGLFGLVAFVAEQKTKEVGIRKVMGATIPEIIILLSKQFAKWIIVASVIACPVSYYFMETWLNDFAYRIEINLLTFILAGAVTLLIAFLTISIQTLKAAAANPIDSLKYE